MRLAGIHFEEEEYTQAASVWEEYRSAYPSGERWLESTYWAGRAYEEAGDQALADSAAMIVGAMQRAITGLELPPRPDAAIRELIGLGLNEGLQRLYPEIETARLRLPPVPEARIEACAPVPSIVIDFVIVTAHSGAFCSREDPSRDCQGEIVEVARRLVRTSSSGTGSMPSRLAIGPAATIASIACWPVPLMAPRP